ncbi:hypothetical protein EGR_03590 [Echinococcus granulosus]|uniref:Uncharacterized protein n=1 Tax=Echinococcus granulosus TaxID=6210 RepID=W6UK54_ECHGR|nr:hypothetical protein EGR_03590 [Echinococcus granulosus]EUB61526.1 hypothetical protein EGR_03590 [Echinococcus granulosus]
MQTPRPHSRTSTHARTHARGRAREHTACRPLTHPPTHSRAADLAAEPTEGAWMVLKMPRLLIPRVASLQGVEQHQCFSIAFNIDSAYTLDDRTKNHARVLFSAMAACVRDAVAIESPNSVVPGRLMQYKSGTKLKGLLSVESYNLLCCARFCHSQFYGSESDTLN